MRIEKEVCLELQKWFLSYHIQAWLNEGDNKFITKHTQKKPDIIIFSKKLNQYIAIEVKNGNIAKNIWDSFKILDYWKDYTDNKIEYYINNEKIEISSFAVATLNSMFGKIFTDDREIISIDNCKDDKWKRVNKERGLEPYNEYPRTHDYVRGLWANWRRIREKKKSPGCGVILCNSLNNKEYFETISNPILFDQQWEYIKGKYQWKVRQKLL